jgi:ElaB/YqjD/DUF883 family membrane-anchored ribosome-binding protein
MARNHEATADHAGDAVDQLRDKAADISQNVRDAATDRYNQVREAAAAKYNDVRDQATGYVTRSKEAAQEWEQSLEGYVQEKPLQAVLIAAGVGLLLGLIWKRS